MKYRAALVVIALVLFAANIAFFAFRSDEAPGDENVAKGQPDVEEIDANWIAFMPAFEASQRSKPERFGVHNPPPGIAYVEDRGGREAVSAIGMVAGECAIDHYAVRNSNDFDEFMPDRLFIGDLSGEEQSCLRENLPSGYKLSRLARAVKPSAVSWTIDPSTLAIQEETNGKTH